MRWTEALEELGQDVRYAGRQLWKSPAFTLVAVLTLALGTGVTTAIYSVVDTVLLRPLPFAEPDRLVRVLPLTREGSQDAFSVLNFLDWRRQSTSTGGSRGAASYDGVTLNLSGDGEPERLQGMSVSASFFSVLGVKPLRGRFFTEGDERAGAPRVVVVSEELWRRSFGADPGLVGRAITLNGEPSTVVGITARGARYPFKPDLWIPFVLDEDALNPTNRGALFLNAIARLEPGVSLEKARAEAAAIARRLELQYPEANTGMGMTVEPMQSDIVADVRLPLLVLMGAVVCVLLIACVNVANLLLVRAAARESEIAIRSALGAGRSRIIRQLLTESVGLALLGGAAGVLLAHWLTRLLVRLAPEGTPRLDEAGIDAPVLLFGLGVTILTGLLFGLVPALQASRPDLNRTLKEGARGAKGGGGRVRHALVVVETALAVILLAGAGLLIQSFARLQQVDLGFDTEGVVTFRFVLPGTKYPERPQIESFVNGIVERVERLPGVRTAGAGFIMPLSGSDFSLSFTVEGRPPVPQGQEPAIKVQVATPEFFQALGIPLVRGRIFDARDRQGAPRVVLLNQAAARRYFPGENPLGKRIQLGWVRDDERQGGEVVGIVGDMKQVGLDQPAEPELYMPFAQSPVASISVVMRASGDPAALAAAARAQVREADPDLPIYNLGPLSDSIAAASAQPRFYMLLLGAFAAVALLLAAVGIYGVM
ncbi:MAG TPA: ABC transporter permease, partial [Thermoanaerobaculia bacterium]|nr:ABC transporter permease [Thermoanaerobaculia bacterium]